MELATNELTARTTLVPPSRFGPPESPKQVPPLLECSLMNSSASVSLLATNVVGAKKRVAEAPSDFLQFGSHGPPPLTKPWTPYPTRCVAGVLIRLGSKLTRTCGAWVVALVPSPDVLSLKQCAAVSITV